MVISDRLTASRTLILTFFLSGKTTLLKLLLGSLEPSKGLRNAHRNLKIGYFSQHHIDQLNLNMNSIEFLQSKFPGQTAEQYRAFLGKFGVSGDLATQPIVALSGGQKSRTAFAAVAMMKPSILILDEPTNHLGKYRFRRKFSVKNSLSKFTELHLLLFQISRAFERLAKRSTTSRAVL